jgi:hypothetical protein
MCSCLAKDTSGLCTYDSTGVAFTITIEAP